MSRFLPIAALALCGVLLRADGLTDLKAALKALPQGPKVRVRIEEESQEREDGKDKVEHRTVQLEDGPEGTTILEDSRRAGAPAKKKASANTPGVKQGSSAFQGTLRPADDLLKQLDKARLAEEKSETWGGQAVRRLKLVMDLELDAEAKSHIKQAVHEATVWIGADGVPLAMDQRIEIKARVLLLASVWTKVDIHQRYQRVQGRLLVQEERSDVQGTAIGKSFGSQETTRCSVLP